MQYAYDLMTEQAKTENVYALVCGDTLFRAKKCRIVKSKRRGRIRVFKILNPTTPSLLYGVSDPDSQTRNVDVDFSNVRGFILKYNIEIFHIHTFMGLPKDVVKYIKSLGVRIVFTTHDYYGICLRNSLINNFGEPCDGPTDLKCAKCNVCTLSDRRLRLANSYLYTFLKRFRRVSLFAKKRTKNHTVPNSIAVNLSRNIITGYADLLNYYKEYYGLIDSFHFNSSQTREIFTKFIPDIRGRVLPVITGSIIDRRQPLRLSKTVKFGYIGSLNHYKGFPMLKASVKELQLEGYDDFKVCVYGGTPTIGLDDDTDLIEYMPPYDYSQISEIMFGLDAIIVPSLWYETFSLVTLEAIAHGRIAIVSDHVGAKDIVNDIDRKMVFSSLDELKNIMKGFISNPDLLVKENRKILSYEWNYDIESHTKEMSNLYKSI